MDITALRQRKAIMWNFDGKYKGSQATIDDDFATLNFEIDNNGKITGISWFYYPEQK